MKAGTVYKWVGLPGQYDPEAMIEIGSMTGSCKINARILKREGIEEAVSLITIGAADLVTAVENGWLVEVEDA